MTVANSTETLQCLDRRADDCSGSIEYREALSSTGRRFPRCDKHWSDRLDIQDGINRRYPVQQPADFSELDAGESWDEPY